MRWGKSSPFDALREFVGYWVDEGRHTPCCQFATDEEIHGDRAMFDCDRCVVADHLDTLAPENARAWSLFHQLCARFVVDTGCTAAVLTRLTAETSAREYADLVARVALIFDVYYPPKRASDGA